MALVTLRSYQNPVAAELAIAQLEASGIPAVALDQHLVSVLSGAVVETRVQVDESDLAVARRLLDELGSDLVSQPQPRARRRAWSRRSILGLILVSVLFAKCTYNLASNQRELTPFDKDLFEQERHRRILW